MLPYARYYLEERNKFLGKSPEDVAELEVETLYWQIRMCWAVSIVLDIHSSFLEVDCLVIIICSHHILIIVNKIFQSRCIRGAIG